MRVAVKPRLCGGGAAWNQAASLAFRSFAPGFGLAVALALSGCAGKAVPQVQYVRVEVPVQVPCQAPEVAVPPWAASGLRKDDSLEVKVRALLAERRQRIGYEGQLVASASSCR
ncbi:hypothetical protein D3C77_550890 [compost metagenome]